MVEQPGVDDVGEASPEGEMATVALHGRGAPKRMCVEQRRHLAPVVRINVHPPHLAASGGRETLAVGARYVGRSEDKAASG